MCSLKFLIVEDEDSDLTSCRDTIPRFEEEKKCKIDLIESKTLDNSIKVIDNSYDGVIIDLKLDKNDGNELIKTITCKYRIPVYILTGTPGNVSPDFGFITVAKKGEVEYYDIFDYFKKIYDTGLTQVYGGRGIIEKTMDEVFWNNIYPQLETWTNYAAEKNTETALLRFTVNNLLELLDDNDYCYPEEMYILPLLHEANKISTGCILAENSTEKYYVVMSPACDLVLYNGTCKTDKILLCEIEDFVTVASKESISKSSIKKIITNNHSVYHHWLPQTKSFKGGLINFRWIRTFSKEEISSDFKLQNVQISSHFVKDIVSRFSSYYARQGQPDFDFENLSSKIASSLKEKASETTDIPKKDKTENKGSVMEDT